MGRGRYAGDIPLQSTDSLPNPRGRGRLTEIEKEKLDKIQFYKKEMHIKKQIQMVSFVIFPFAYSKFWCRLDAI